MAAPVLADQDFERLLSTQTNLSAEEKAAVRAEHAQRKQAARLEEARSRIAEAVGTEQQAQAGSTLRSAAGTGAAAVLHGGNTASFGALPTMMGAIGSGNPMSYPFKRAVGGEANALETDTDTALAVSEQTNPLGALVGKIGGFFGGPRAAVSAAVGGAASARLTRAAADAAQTSLLRSAAAQIAAGFTGAAAAGAVDQTLAGTIEGDSFGNIAGRAATSALVGGALGATGGAVTAAFRAKADREVLRLIQEGERVIPGLKLSPAEFRTPGFLNSVLESASFSPAGRAWATKVLDSGFYKPLEASKNTLVTALGGKPGASVGETREAAAGAYRAAAGRVAGKIRAGTDQVSQVVDDAGYVPNDVLRGMAKSIVQATDGFQQTGRVGQTIAELRRAAINASSQGKMAGGDSGVAWRTVEDLRTELGGMAQWDRFARDPRINQVGLSDADVRAAKSLYRVVREVERHHDPLNAALQNLQKLRREASLLETVGRDLKTQDAAALSGRIFAAKDFRQRWAAVQRTMTPDELATLRGHYLGEFYSEVGVAQNAAGQTRLSLHAMQRLLNGAGDGKFRREVFDRVLGPEARDAVMAQAKISDLVSRNMGVAQGSPTAQREAGNRALDGVGQALAHAASGDVGAGVSGLTRTFGSIFFRAGLAKSILDGKLRDVAIRLSTGQPVGVASVTPTAFGALAAQSTTAPMGGER